MKLHIYYDTSSVCPLNAQIDKHGSALIAWKSFSQWYIEKNRFLSS